LTVTAQHFAAARRYLDARGADRAPDGAETPTEPGKKLPEKVPPKKQTEKDPK